MNKLDYSVSLRKKGLSSEEIKKKLKEKDFEEAQIQYYLKKSDEIFLSQSFHNNRSKNNGKTRSGMRMLALVLSLILLASVFFGYARIGLLGLFFVWSLIGFSSYRK